VSQRRGNEYWINPPLEKFNLVRKKEEDIVRKGYWDRIEKCELSDRIGKVVGEVNRAAGYHILEIVDFLPPQKNVLRISFDRRRIKHYLELVIRPNGVVLMFSTGRRLATVWGRIISPTRSTRHTALIWEEAIEPEEILDQNIQAWISYLLSGLDKKFRLDQILHASPEAESELSEALRKASA
jgi:hypothetical protein